MKDRLLLLLYFAAVILITSIHQLGFLLVCLGLVFILSGKQLLTIFKKAVIAVAAFNLVVTISYIVISSLRGEMSPTYVALLNLRVMTLTSLTFLTFDRVNLFKALAFSRSLMHLLVLAYSQTLTLLRLFEEFRSSLKSRSLRRPGLKDLYRHGASTGAHLTHKSLHDAAETAQAMKSRGFFND